jgi:hypothetical protein
MVLKQQEIDNQASKSILRILSQATAPSSSSEPYDKDAVVPATLRLDPRLRNAFENQDKRWLYIHRKMDASVQQHRRKGNLRHRSKAEVIADYSLPEAMRRSMIGKLLFGIVSVPAAPLCSLH